MTSKITQKCSEGNIETSEQNENPKSRHRAYCFTDFTRKEPLFDKDIMKYLCYSPEVTPTTNRHHWQGYFYLHDGKTMSAATKVFKDRKISVKFCLGSPEENRIYCGAEDYTFKDKTKLKNPLFKEFGKIPSQGERIDLKKIKNEIMNGKSVDEIAEENAYAYHQYGRTLEKLETIYLKKNFRTEMTKCIWYWGRTGVGKSHKAFENYSDKTHYLHELNDKGWWDDYRGQETVIFNEFRGEIKYNDLLELVDKWPKKVPRRGCKPIHFTSKLIIITSPMPPEECYLANYTSTKDNIEQLLRRIEVIHLH